MIHQRHESCLQSNLTVQEVIAIFSAFSLSVSVSLSLSFSISICLSVCLSVCLSIYLSISHTHTHTHTHAHTHTHTHAHIHAHARTHARTGVSYWHNLLTLVLVFVLASCSCRQLPELLFYMHELRGELYGSW